MTRKLHLLVSLAFLSGCFSITPIEPRPPYTSVSPEKRLNSISVTGFPHQVWVPVGYSNQYGLATAQAYANFNSHYGYGNAFGVVSTTRYDYKLAPSQLIQLMAKRFLENAGAAHVVKLGGDGEITIEGIPGESGACAVNILINIFYDVPMAVTLLALFGVPTWGYYYGEAEVRVYDKNGAFLKQYIGKGKVRCFGDYYSYSADAGKEAAVFWAYVDALDQFCKDLERGQFPVGGILTDSGDPHRLKTEQFTEKSLR